MISSADALATKAGVLILEQNGNAVDAAIATSAAMAVVAPHLCGMGGDLFALVHVDGQVHSLNAAGRAGSGVNPEQLRQQGFAHVPMNANFNSITVPGCVAGWLALHERFGTLPLELLFADAIGLAENGFRSSPLLINSFKRLDDSLKRNFKDLYSATTEVAPTIKRPGVGRTLRAVATHGSDAFYAGEFAEELLRRDAPGSDLVMDRDLDGRGVGCSGADGIPRTGRVGHARARMSKKRQGIAAVAGAALVDQSGMRSASPPVRPFCAATAAAWAMISACSSMRSSQSFPASA